MANALNGSNGGGTTYPSIVDIAGEIKLADSLIQIGNDTPLSDTIDSGFYSKYSSSGTRYTGLARLAGYGTKDYWLFAGSSLSPQTDGTYSLTSNLAPLHTGALYPSSILSNNLLISGDNTLTAIAAASGTGNLFNFLDTANTSIYTIDSSGNFVINTKNLSGVNNLTCAKLTSTGEVMTVNSGQTNSSVVIGSNISTFPANKRSVLIGKAGNAAMTGASNVVLGCGTGSNLTSGATNVLIGDAAGQTLTSGTGNVFIGNQAGLSETLATSNKLHIANANTATPLISGDFTNQYVNIYNKLNVNSTQTTQSLYVNGNSQIMGRFGVNAIGPGACVNFTGEVNNGQENQTLYVAGSPLRNATYSANYNSIATYFNAANSAAGSFYNYYGLNIGQNAGPSARIANSFGAYIANPNMSTTGYNLALYADDITIGSTSGKIANGFYCQGSAQIRTQQSIGATVPQASTRLYIDAGGIATESYAIQSNAYPARTSGVSSYANITAYANWTEVKGGTMNYIGIDAGSTSGSNPFIGSAYGIYCRNPNASTTPANNIALFTDDISIGSPSKIAGGLYCNGSARIQSQMGIGAAPGADTRLTVSGGSIASEIYNIQSIAYPTRAAGAGGTSFTNVYVYGGWTNLAGGLLNYVALDVGNTPGPNALINTSIGLYARNPNGATNPANNIAIYADDISVGNTMNKITNGIYCSSDMKCGGNLYNGSYSTSTPFYSVFPGSFTVSYTGSTGSVKSQSTFTRVGAVVNVSIGGFTYNPTGAGTVSINIPSGYAPTSNVVFPAWMASGGVGYLMSSITVNSAGTIVFNLGYQQQLAYGIGSYTLFLNPINLSWVIIV